MTQHTPGEWIIIDRTVYALDETGRVNRFTASVQPGYSNAPMYGDRIRTTPEELAANVRLIAAAPDLLAALKELTLYQPSVTAHNAALVAIAKATGE